MNITKTWLIDQDTSSIAIKFAEEKNLIDLPPADFCEKLVEYGEIHYLFWIIFNILDNKDVVKYIVHFVESNLGIFEENFPDDKCLKKALNKAKLWLINKATEREACLILDIAPGIIILSRNLGIYREVCKELFDNGIKLVREVDLNGGTFRKIPLSRSIHLEKMSRINKIRETNNLS